MVPIVSTRAALDSVGGAARDESASKANLGALVGRVSMKRCLMVSTRKDPSCSAEAAWDKSVSAAGALFPCGTPLLILVPEHQCGLSLHDA